MSYTIFGKITNKETGNGIAGLRVQAWDKDKGYVDDYLGEIITGENGEFVIEYTEDAFDQFRIDEKPDIYLLVTNLNGAIIYSTEDKVRYEAGKDEIFNIQISKELLNATPDLCPEDFVSDLRKRLKE
ncbi:MAG: hypothetical protein ACFFD2_14180 [Promethearchaeota archaeon]